MYTGPCIVYALFYVAGDAQGHIPRRVRLSESDGPYVYICVAERQFESLSLALVAGVAE